MRSTVGSPRVLVLGGKGFIGRHAVAHLVESTASVTVGTRSPASNTRLPEERFTLHRQTHPSDWRDVVGRFDVVVNCVGILRQRFRETYEAVHHLAPSAIAQACRDSGTRFVHVSALGLSGSAKSRFLTSKHRGEQAIAEVGGDCVIVRISLLDGEGGYGAAWLRGVARLPVFVVPTSARGRIAALTATDAGEALSRLCLMDARAFPRGSTLELGGATSFQFEGYVRGLRRRYSASARDPLCVPVPGWLARLGAHVCDGLHFSPFSFGHWELLCRDNVPARPDLAAILGREPEEVIGQTHGASKPKRVIRDRTG